MKIALGSYTIMDREEEEREKNKKKRWKFMEVVPFVLIYSILVVVCMGIIAIDRTASTSTPIWVFVSLIVIASLLPLATTYDHYFGDK